MGRAEARCAHTAHILNHSQVVCFVSFIRYINNLLCKVAERGGFEPPVQLLTVQRFSKPPPSATRPSLRVLRRIIPEVAVTPRKGSKETHRTHRLSPVSFPFL